MTPFVAPSIRLARPLTYRGVAEKWAPRAPASGTVESPTVPAPRPPASIPGSSSTYGVDEGAHCARCNVSTPTPITRPALMVGPADETINTPTPTGPVNTTTSDDPKRQWYIIGGVVLVLVILWLLSQKRG